MALTFTTLPDFIVTIDRAGHLVVDQLDENGDLVRTIDFGAAGCDVTGLVNSWFQLYDVDRDALAPAVNAYLLAEFAKQA